MKAGRVVWLLAAGLLLFGGAARAQAPGGSCTAGEAGSHTCNERYCVKCVSNVWTIQAVQTGASAATCDSTISGTIRLEGTALEYCNGTSWTSAGGAGGTAAGADTQVQFNDGGAMGGDAEHTWNKTTNVLTVAGQISVSDRVLLGSTTGAATPTGYVTNVAGAPSSTLCDANEERGRLTIDTTNNRLYVCNGASRGWDYVALTN